MQPALLEVATWMVATILVLGAVTKLTPEPPIRSTLVALGVSDRRLLLVLPAVIGVSELMVASLFVIGRQTFVGLLIALAGIGFATVGGYAIIHRLSISCHCFGRSDSTLGWTQIFSLPLWILAGSIPFLWPAWSAEPYSTRSATAIAVLSATAVLLLIKLVPLWSDATRRRLVESRRQVFVRLPHD